MDNSTPINKMINSWNTIDKLKRSVLLLGYGHTGRSTFCELIKKYHYRIKSNQLTFDSNKYALEGIIATKSIKLQTITPVLYENQPHNKDELKILDVPSYAFSPENKKWTGLEQKLTLKYLIQKNQKVIFLLFVEEKNTRSNVTSWKKSVQSFLQFFQLSKIQPNYDLFNSVAMIITKCPPEVKQDTMVKRIKNLQIAMEKDKIFDQALIEKFCKVFLDSNNILIFEKISDDDRQRQETIKNVQILEKIQGYKINPEDFRQLAFTPEEQKSFSSYYKTADEVIKNVASCVKEIIQLEQFSLQNIRQIKNKYFSDIGSDIKITEQVKKKFDKLKKQIHPFTFIKHYGQVCKDIVQISSLQDFFQILDHIIDLNIFIDEQDIFIFQIIIEAFEFKKVSGINMIQFGNYSQTYQNLYKAPLKGKAYKRMVQAQKAVTEVSMQKEFYEYAVKSLNQFLRQIPQSLTQFSVKCTIQLNKHLNPKMAMTSLLQTLKQDTPKDKAYGFVSQIAYILKAKQLYIDSARIYKISKNPHEAIECFKHIFGQSQEYSLQYIQYLKELNLFYDAKKASMQAYARLGYKSRSKLGESLKKIEEQERKYLKGNSSNTNSLLQQISEQEIQQIKRIAQKVLQKL